MIGFVLVKRITKSYILVVLMLYACVTFRMLEYVFHDIAQTDASNKNYRFDGKFEIQLENVTFLINKLLHQRNNLNSGDFSLLKLLREHNIKSEVDVEPVLFNIDYVVSGAYPIKKRVYTPTSKYIINCKNIHEIDLKRKIGHGVSKQTLLGDFRGMPVAVKMVTRHQREVRYCIEKLNQSDTEFLSHRAKCFMFSSMKLMKEILMLEQLSHPGFIKLLGYCVRNEESDTMDLSERGVISVYELGTRISVYSLQNLTWRERIQHSLHLARFLYYLEFSPLGSLRIRDFKEEHFLMINGTLKMIDLDDVDNLEPSCSVYINEVEHGNVTFESRNKGCDFAIPCHNGLCVGFNAKQNMKFMYKLFFNVLIRQTAFPNPLSGDLRNVLERLDCNRISAAELIAILDKLSGFDS
ncbi:extracellular tyrosine-protein kinase PKDCC-like [Dreissena polymorpha]|uniref:Protein kinase domain-containing protein n=1 Tax=Dreissena polymorpha TaxID=45954 RepID=A0A9D4G262_DREPO|nr:extracellular tyrosine-protein kinase PKDCC-like [Dreissena polymorpha]KAH3807253.1 hypothetical protein DPMN_135588 [Dreissena polymorpha]